MCPNCKKQIIWYDNIPFVSYILLSGKCRHCKKPISIQYPAIELGTGIIFLAIWLYSPPGKFLSSVFFQLINNGVRLANQVIILNILMLLILFFIAGLLIVITMHDLKTKEIPNGFNLTFIISALAYTALVSINAPDPLIYFLWYLVSAVFAFLFFYTFVFFSKETWMGGGDAKLALGIGLLLGPASTFIAILIASWVGAIYGISLIILKKAGRKTEIPFGPFLVLGTFVSVLYGSQLISWYVRIFLGL